MDIIKQISNELKISEDRIKTTIELLNEGNTVPFIARYRKEMTGNLKDEQIFSIKDKYDYLLKFNERKEYIKETIEEKGKLNEEIIYNLNNATTLQELEDIYLPYKSSRKTLADTAKENGLEPLAKLIWKQESLKDLSSLASDFINEEVPTKEDVLEGAKHIIISYINEDIIIRKIVRSLTLSYGLIETSSKKEKLDQYEQYKDYSQSVASIPPHRVLAINRAEKEEYISVSITPPQEDILTRLNRDLIEKYIQNKEIKLFLLDSIDT